MGQEADLAQVLAFRDRKAAVQRDFAADGRGKTVVSLGMNVPGPVKTGELLSEAFCEGMASVERMFGDLGVCIAGKTVLEEPAGYAAVYLIESADRYCYKKEAIRIEAEHPLGRLFDIDIMDETGRPLARESVGGLPRPCFLCGKDAKACGRSRAHSVEELRRKVDEILRQWNTI